MRKLVIVTYVLRGLGFVLVLLSLFGHSLILNVFPGLEGTSINPIFYSGIAVYLVGAVIYFFVNINCFIWNFFLLKFNNSFSD